MQHLPRAIRRRDPSLQRHIPHPIRIRKRTRCGILGEFFPVLWPMTVVQREDELCKVLPDCVFRDGFAAAFVGGDDSSEVSAAAELTSLESVMVDVYCYADDDSPPSRYRSSVPPCRVSCHIA
jgi:hypothetical protein